MHEMMMGGFGMGIKKVQLIDLTSFNTGQAGEITEASLSIDEVDIDSTFLIVDSHMNASGVSSRRGAPLVTISSPTTLNISSAPTGSVTPTTIQVVTLEEQFQVISGKKKAFGGSSTNTVDIGQTIDPARSFVVAHSRRAASFSEQYELTPRCTSILPTSFVLRRSPQASIEQELVWFLITER